MVAVGWRFQARVCVWPVGACATDICDAQGIAPGGIVQYRSEGATEGGIAAENVIVLPNEPDAVQRALEPAPAAQIVVIFADDSARAWKQVIYFGKERQAPGAGGVAAGA